MNESRVNDNGVLIDAENVVLINNQEANVVARIALHEGRYYYGYSIMLKTAGSSSPCTINGSSKDDYKSAVRAVIEMLSHHNLIDAKFRAALYEKHAEFSQLNLF